MWARTRHGLRRIIKHESGVQVLEFAIAFPFLMLLFASAVEMGRLFYTYTTLVKATDVGARYLSDKPLGSGGAFSSADTTTAKNLIICGRASCSGQTPIVPGLTDSMITITPPPAVVSTTRYVNVRITYQYTPLLFNLQTRSNSSNGVLSLNFDLAPGTTMRYMLLS